MTDEVKSDDKKEGAETPLSSNRKSDKEITLENPAVKSGGKSSIGISILNADGRVVDEVSVVQENGVVKLPNDPKSFAVRDTLIKSGFHDKTDYGFTAKTPEVVESKPRPVKWYFAHPDSTKENPINASCGFYVNGNEVSVVFKEGKTTVTDEALAHVMETAGFWVEKTDVK